MSHIPPFYRIFFLYIDPLICLSGIYLSLFDQPTFLLNGVPSRLLPTYPSGTSQEEHPNGDPLISHFLFSIGSYSIGILSLQILLLHQVKDAPAGLNVKIWKILEFAILLVDLGLLAAGGVSVDASRRTEEAWGVGSWTSGDWTNNGILGAVALIRTAFLLNVGGVGRTK